VSRRTAEDRGTRTAQSSQRCAQGNAYDQFFALAVRRMRWELNDLARRLDKQPSAVERREELAPRQFDIGLAV
jgi:hypothetical protein